MADKRIRLHTGAGDNSADDRISNLPQPIIHHILSPLSGKDVIRTCVLSKSLLSSLTSFPVIDLDFSWFKQGYNVDRFLDYVNYSLQRLNITHTALEKFRFRVHLTSQEQARRAVKAIDSAITHRLKLLDIDFESCRYSLPRSFRLASSITTLNLAGLKLMNLLNDDMMVFLSVLENLSISNCTGLKVFNFSSTTIKSVSLKSCAGLNSIKIQSPSLQSLIFTGKSLRNITEIDVSDCRFLKLLWLADVSMYNWVDENIPKLLHLEELKLINTAVGGFVTTVCSQDLKRLQCEGECTETLKIRAKNLESLIIRPIYDYCKIDIEIPRSLKHLSISKLSIPHDMVRNLARGFFGLGSIELEYDSSCNLTRMEMNQQKGLKLLGRTDQMFQITVRIPNYDSFKFNKLVPPTYVLKSTCPLEFTLCLETDGAPVYRHSFVTLWNWVASFGKVEFFTLSCQSFEVLLCLEQLKAVSLSSMYDLKKLTVEYNTWASVSPEMIDCFLSTSPNLKTIWFASTKLEADDKSIRFHYGSRTGPKDDPKCCSSVFTLCWRHSLKKVELKNFDRDDEEKLIHYFLKNTTDLDIFKYNQKTLWFADTVITEAEKVDTSATSG